MGATTPIIPVYILGGLNEPLPLYTGGATIRTTHGEEASGEVTVDFAWLPTPQLAFNLDSAADHWWNRPDPGYEISLDDFAGRPATDATVHLLTVGSTKATQGRLGRFSVGGGVADRIVFLLPNWPSLLGSRLDDAESRGSWMGRVVLEDNEWRVTLDARRDLQTLEPALRTAHGYAFTHVGEIRRRDGDEFDIENGEALLRLLHWYLGFARGFWTSPTLPVAFRGEQVVWREFAAPVISPWRANRSWFSGSDPAPIIRAFDGFSDRWKKSRWRESLELAVSWIVEANPSDPAERSIVEAQVAIELLGWLIMVEDAGLISRTQWKNTEAVDNVRAVLKHINHSVSIPPALAAAARLAAEENWVDGPAALTGFRNRLVHPRDRAKQVLSMPVMGRVELAEFASSYAELMLLFFCGYEGVYFDRAWRINGPVPWDTDGP